MDQTPTSYPKVYVESLSKSQKRKSVGEQAKREKVESSASKPKRPAAVRSTVLNPIEIQWPFLVHEDAQRLMETLKSDLQILKGLKSKPSLREIREIPKKERREYRQKKKSEEAEKAGFDSKVHAVIRKSLALGVNSCSRSLEGNNLAVVILESEVDPPIMTKLLVSMAVNKKVPVIAVPGLAELVAQVAEFRCIALGIKTDLSSENNPLNKLRNTLLEFANLVDKTNTRDAEDTSSTPAYNKPKIRRV